MPVAFIPCGEWIYDKGFIGGANNFVSVIGMVPEGNRYVNGIKFAGDTTFANFSTSAAAATPVTYATMHIHQSPTFTNPVIYVDNGNGTIYRTTSPFTATTSEATGLTASKEGCFTSYGDNVLWTNLTDEIKTIKDADFATTTFVKNNIIAAPTSHDPKAKFLGTIKNHLLIANIDLTGVAAANRPAALASTTYPDYIWWSKTDDPTRFGTVLDTPTITGSGYLPLSDDAGPITGLIGGDYALVFKRTSVYRIDGPPFQAAPIVIGSGTIYNQSICRLYGDTYFWSEGGPAVIRENGQFEYLTKGKISRLIDDNIAFSDVSVNPFNKIFGASNHKKNTVVWFCNSGNNVYEYGIEYNADVDRFGQVDISVIYNKNDNTVMGSGLASLKSYPRYSIPYSPGSEYYGIGLEALATQYRHRLVTGFRDKVYGNTSNLQSLDYGLIKLAGEDKSVLTRITRVRPIWRYGSDSVPVFGIRIQTTNDPNNITIPDFGGTSYTQKTSEGWYPTPTTTVGAYHQIGIDVTLGKKTSSGTEIFATDEGFAGLEIEYEESSLRGV